MKSLTAQPRPEDVWAARAKVDEARSELVQTSDMRNKYDLRAPFDGVVADLVVEEGQSVSAGEKMIVFHEAGRQIIEIETDEDNLAALKLGQTAVVSSDAFPGRTFDAVLYDLGSMVNPERGTVKIRLRPVGPVDWLRPDQTVDVNIVIRRGVRHTILPADTVIRYQRHPVVLVVKNGVAIPVPVVSSAAGSNGLVVSGKLRDGDLIVRKAENVARIRMCAR